MRDILELAKIDVWIILSLLVFIENYQGHLQGLLLSKMCSNPKFNQTDCWKAKSIFE